MAPTNYNVIGVVIYDRRLFTGLTHVLSPSTIHWMDIFSHLFVVKCNVCLKRRKWTKKRPVTAHFVVKKDSRATILSSDRSFRGTAPPSWRWWRTMTRRRRRDKIEFRWAASVDIAASVHSRLLWTIRKTDLNDFKSLRLIKKTVTKQLEPWCSGWVITHV